MFKYLLSLLALFASTTVFAQVRFELLNPESYSKETRAAISLYFSETQKYLPSKIAPLGTEKVYVQFKDLGGSALQMVQPSNTGVLVGYVNRFSQKPTIVLNSKLISFVSETHWATYPALRHGQGKKFAMATLLHELAHIIDFNATRDPRLSEDLSKCKDPRRFPNYIPANFKLCNEALAVLGNISDHPDFRRQVRWTNISHSENHPGSPNRYEFENANEYFAVNFEYFLLDPQFKCRRPSLYQTYKTIFKWAPFENENCETGYKVFFHDKGESIILDPRRVMNISYFHAGPGVAMMSNWGHSMLRLMVCRRDLQSPADTCSKETQDVVVAFQAYLPNNIINNWEGLVGNYSSRLFVLSRDRVVNAYNSKEFRDVDSYSLNLTAGQKTQLIHKVLESYWGYSGRYYFVTNNCASEAFSLIRSVLPSGHVLNNKILNTPIALLKVLKEVGLISIEDQKFSSLKPTLDQSLDILSYDSKRGGKMSLDEYLLLPPQERFELFTGKSSIREKAAYKILEGYIISQKNIELADKTSEMIFKVEGAKPNEATSFIKSSLYNYGLPANDEVVSEGEYKDVWTASVKAIKEKHIQYSTYFPEIQSDLLMIEENIKKAMSF